MDSVRLFSLAQTLVRSAPEMLVRPVFETVGYLVGLSNTAGVRQLRANQKRFTGVTSRAHSARAMRSYMRYYYEVFRLPALTHAQIDARVSVQGLEYLTHALEQETSVVGALTHSGNWDLAGTWASRHVAPVHTIAEKLEPPELFEMFMRFRSKQGMTIYPLVTGSGALRSLEDDMRTTSCFTPLLADRDLTASGVEVELAGEKAMVAPGPALLAIRTGKPILPVFSSYERLDKTQARQAGTPWGMRLDVCAPIYPRATATSPYAEVEADIVRMTQEWVSALEPYVRAHSDDWHMLQKVFVTDLDPERLKKTREKARMRKNRFMGEESA